MTHGLAALCHLYYGSTCTNTTVEDVLSPEGSLWTLFIANENTSVLTCLIDLCIYYCVIYFSYSCLLEL